MATVAELAELVAGELVGDGAVIVDGFNDLQRAGAGEITFLADRKRLPELAACRAAALIGPKDLPASDQRPLIRVANPYLAAARIQQFLEARPFVAGGVAAGAVIGADCLIPAAVTIGPGVVLGDRVRLGDKVTIGPNTVIGDGVEIGDETVIHPNVTVYPGCLIGRRVIIHAGSVIGSDGFGYATDRQGRHYKRLHKGIVRIGDEVEIGANVCIDRATFGETLIGAGSKIDNLVQIGHNAEVGENCLLVAQVGISGSCRLGRQVVMGGQSALAGHISMGDGVMIAAQAGVHNNQPAGAVVAGSPAIAHKQWLRASVLAGKLPEIHKELRELRRQVQEWAGLQSTGKE